MILLDCYFIWQDSTCQGRSLFSGAIVAFTSAFLTDMINQLKAEILTGSRSPDRWLKEPWDNQLINNPDKRDSNILWLSSQSYGRK
mgnify:CR=1 FL=1